jgi:hypothetical protein
MQNCVVVAVLAVVLSGCSGGELTPSGAAQLIRESDRLTSGCLVTRYCVAGP